MISIRSKKYKLKSIITMYSERLSEKILIILFTYYFLIFNFSRR